MTKVYIKSDQDWGDKRYTYNETNGNVHRAPVGLPIDPTPTPIGNAENLSDALSIIKSHDGGNNHQVTAKR
jgi:hypothetical protein